MTELQKVKAVTDNEGHWYIIPNRLLKSFSSLLEKEDKLDEGEFDNIFSKYRTGGDLNNVQLFAEI